MVISLASNWTSLANPTVWKSVDSEMQSLAHQNEEMRHPAAATSLASLAEGHL
jgi:hypothetical protein